MLSYQFLQFSFPIKKDLSECKLLKLYHLKILIAT